MLIMHEVQHFRSEFRIAAIVMLAVVGLLVGESQAAWWHSGPRKGKTGEETKVVSVNSSANTITVKQANNKDSTTTYTVDHLTTITINGQKGDLASIKPGMIVTIDGSGPGGLKADRIDATGSGSSKNKK